MQKITKKTEADRQAETTYKEIKVSDTHYYFWVCDKCDVAFFKEDIILLDSNEYHKCPLIIRKGILGKKSICNNQISGGDKNCFDRYYKLKSP